MSTETQALPPYVPAQEHVKIGHGRHHTDVAPIRGVYRGAAGEASHDVSVKMTRLG